MTINESISAFPRTFVETTHKDGNDIQIWYNDIKIQEFWCENIYGTSEFQDGGIYNEIKLIFNLGNFEFIKNLAENVRECNENNQNLDIVAICQNWPNGTREIMYVAIKFLKLKIDEKKDRCEINFSCSKMV